MRLTSQKRIAAQILKVGTTKVFLDPAKSSEIKEAITKSDIRSLIRTKAIRAKRTPEQSRGRVRRVKLQKRKGNLKGPGSKKGKKTSRLSRKALWIAKIRTQRKFLKMLREKKIVDNKIFKELSSKSKGGFFRNKRHIKLYMEEHGLFKKK